MASRSAVFEKFGQTAEVAQLFETDLGTILLALEGEQRSWHLSPDPDSASAFYEKLNKKTLGQILTGVKSFVDLDDHVETIFQRALSARNRLNHGFFEGHNFAIYSPEGRDAMLADLEKLHTELFAAWQTSQRVSSFLVERLIDARST